jgi:hypothetical protein
VVAVVKAEPLFQMAPTQNMAAVVVAAILLLMEVPV